MRLVYVTTAITPGGDAELVSRSRRYSLNLETMSEYEEMIEELSPLTDDKGSATVSIERSASINFQSMKVMVSVTLPADREDLMSGLAHEISSVIAQNVLHQTFDEALFPEFEKWAPSVRR